LALARKQEKTGIGPADDGYQARELPVGLLHQAKFNTSAIRADPESRTYFGTLKPKTRGMDIGRRARRHRSGPLPSRAEGKGPDQ